MLFEGDEQERPDRIRSSKRGIVLLAIGYAVVALVVLYFATYRLEGTAGFVLTVLAVGPAPFVGLALGRHLSKSR